MGSYLGNLGQVNGDTKMQAEDSWREELIRAFTGSGKSRLDHHQAKVENVGQRFCLAVS